MAKKLTIADKTSRVTLCSMNDVVEEAGYIRLFRRGIYSGYAEITAHPRGQAFAPQGMTVEEPRIRPSHAIRMTYRPDTLISSAAWIYQEFRKSAPRWFKILKVVEDVGCEFRFECRLVERDDDITQPVAASNTVAPSHGVEL